MVYVARPTELDKMPEACHQCPFCRRQLVVEVQCIQTSEWMDGQQAKVKRSEKCPLIEKE